MKVIIYAIPTPYSPGTIQVYGDRDMAAYEWRIMDHTGRVLIDTGDTPRLYGQPEIALRDALMTASGLTDGYTMEAARCTR